MVGTPPREQAKTPLTLVDTMEEKEYFPDDADRSDPIPLQLRRLGSRPVDTTHLARRVRAALNLPDTQVSVIAQSRSTLFRVAAMFLVAGSVFGTLCWRVGRPVRASAVDLAQAHIDNIVGEPGAISATSMAEAHRVIAVQWADCPHVSEPAGGQVISCHVHILGGKRLLCIKLSVDGMPVTLAVGRTADLRLPDIPLVTYSNRQYFVQIFGQTNIVVTDRNGLWLSLIGQTSTDRLIEIADTITGA